MMATPAEPRPPAPRAPLPRWKKLVFALVPLLAFLLVAELIARIARDPFHFESYRLLRIDQMKRGYPAVRDPELGYVPKPDYRAEDSRWGTTVTIDARGFRSNGAPTPDGRPVVAVGDSFTFGDEVHDHETWPAQLERILDQPVLNGGVFGYSFTQAVLRAERILQDVPAEWLIVSFIPDDLTRSEFSKRYTAVPWFDIVDGGLVLRNVPVDETVSPEEQRARDFKNLLGHSALLDAVIANTWTDWWVTNEKQVRVHPPGRGGEIGLLLVDRIAAVCEARACELLLVLQGDGHDAPSLALLERARARGAHALDLTAAFQTLYAKDPTLHDRFFDGHMTAAGNRWAAEQIAAVIADER